MKAIHAKRRALRLKLARWHYRQMDRLTLKLYRWTEWFGSKILLYRDQRLMMSPYAVRTIEDRWDRPVRERR